jgi:hypothetical protein
VCLGAAHIHSRRCVVVSQLSFSPQSLNLSLPPPLSFNPIHSFLQPGAVVFALTAPKILLSFFVPFNIPSPRPPCPHPKHQPPPTQHPLTERSPRLLSQKKKIKGTNHWKRRRLTFFSLPFRFLCSFAPYSVLVHSFAIESLYRVPRFRPHATVPRLFH